MSDDSRVKPVPLDRFRVAAGLRDLATFIERNPELPIPNLVEISLSVIADSDQEEYEEIDRIADILGVTAKFLYGAHFYEATRNFGPVSYSAVSISQEFMRDHNAKMSRVDTIDKHGTVTSEEWPV